MYGSFNNNHTYNNVKVIFGFKVYSLGHSLSTYSVCLKEEHFVLDVCCTSSSTDVDLHLGNSLHIRFFQMRIQQSAINTGGNVAQREL